LTVLFRQTGRVDHRQLGVSELIHIDIKKLAEIAGIVLASRATPRARAIGAQLAGARLGVRPFRHRRCLERHDLTVPAKSQAFVRALKRLGFKHIRTKTLHAQDAR
jgi:hypothetical protein